VRVVLELQLALEVGEDRGQVEGVEVDVAEAAGAAATLALALALTAVEDQIPGQRHGGERVFSPF
jgi:hypothetical protein